MAKIMQMPKLSDTMTEGVVAQWLVKEGDKVKAGAPILEIETDKATMEYEATASGVLLKILVGDGESCALQAPIAVIGKEGEDWKEAVEKHKSSSGGGAASSSKSSPPSEPGSGVAPTPGPSGSQEEKSVGQQSSVNTGTAPSSGRVKASPLAKKVARDRGLDLSTLQGSGPNGRIVVRDLEGATAGAASGSARVDAPVERVPHSNMRKTIARRLTESVQTAPHFYLSLSLKMDDVLNWRKAAVSKLSKEEKFSVNDVMIALVARALKKHPEINASWHDDHIARYRDVHMGMAVALPAGLVTPVVRHADKLTVLEIAEQTKSLASRAKEGQLRSEDYQGGTFTISNLGMAGIENFTAIINPPQSAILAVGAALPTPVAKADGSIEVETRMTITLSCDHRVIDGAVGSAFLQTLKKFVEDPFTALLLS